MSSRLVSRQFLVVTAATLAFFTYVGTMIPLIPALIEQGLGGNKFDIGLTMASFSVAAIACRPLLSKLGERFGMRWLMIVGASVALAATVAAAYVNNRYVLQPFRALQGVGEAFLFVGGATLVAQSAPPARRAEAASYYSVGVFVGIGLGPALTDSLVNDHRFRAAFFVGGVFVALAGVLAMLSPYGRINTAATAARRGVDAAVSDHPGTPVSPRQPRLHRGAFGPGIVLAIGIATFAPFTAFMPDHAKKVGFGGAAAVFGLYSAICLILRIAGARLPERIGLTNAVSGSMIGLAVGMTVLAAFPTKLGVIGGTALLALGISLLFPSLSALATNAAADDEQVRVMSTFTMFFEIGVAIGGLTFGLVANLTNSRGAFVGAAISALLGLAVVRLRMSSAAQPT